MGLSWFTRPKKTGINRPRRTERVNALGLSCHLGEVIDMSAGGMRVAREGRPGVERGSVFQVVLKSPSQRVQVGARVVWLRRVSWKRWEVGLQFIGVAPGVAEALVELARFGYIAPRKAKAPPADAPASAGGQRGPVSADVVSVEDLYTILGVVRNASEEQIHDAYRRLARELHPDVNSEPDAPARFTLISKAYAVLREADKRARYDALLDGCARTRSDAA